MTWLPPVCPAALPDPLGGPAAFEAPSPRPCGEGGVSSRRRGRAAGLGRAWLRGRHRRMGLGGWWRAVRALRAAGGGWSRAAAPGERGAGWGELGRCPGTAPCGCVGRRCPPRAGPGPADPLCLPARPHLPQPLRRRGPGPLLPGAQRLEEGQRPPH